jgi:hypothetical protein
MVSNDPGRGCWAPRDKFGNPTGGTPSDPDQPTAGEDPSGAQEERVDHGTGDGPGHHHPGEEGSGEEGGDPCEGAEDAEAG